MKRNFIFALSLFTLICGGLFSAAADPSTSAWELLKELIMIPGVSGYEKKVAEYIQSRLPQELEARTDEMHNLWFTVGKGKPHLVFVAHTDELGFVVEEITSLGTLKVSSHCFFALRNFSSASFRLLISR